MQQPKRDAANMPSKHTTSTWIKFDIMGKTGVKKLPSLALVDLEVDKNFMSYGTWVLSGHPILDQAQKTIQSCGKSSDECLGLVNSTIHINSQLLEGELFVLTPKHLQVDLVLGRQLAKVALELQKPQAAHDKERNAQIKADHQLQAQTMESTTSLEPNSSETAKAPTASEDQSTGASSLEDGSTKLATTKGTIHEEAKVDISSNAQGTNKATLQVLEPVKTLKYCNK